MIVPMRGLHALVLAAVLPLALGCESTRPGDGDARLRDPIQISGRVYEWLQAQTGTFIYGPPVPGATVSTSLDEQTATSDAAGAFSLVTVTQKPVAGCFEYTVSVTAPGRPTVSVTGDWGEKVVNAMLVVSQTPQMVPHCY